MAFNTYGTDFDVVEGVQRVANLVWDTETLQWIRSTGTGADSSAESSSLMTLFDQVSPTLLYVGKAVPGSSEISPVWKIAQIIFNESGFPVSIKFYDSGRLTGQWDLRASLSYA